MITIHNIKEFFNKAGFDNVRIIQDPHYMGNLFIIVCKVKWFRRWKLSNTMTRFYNEYVSKNRTPSCPQCHVCINPFITDPNQRSIIHEKIKR